MELHINLLLKMEKQEILQEIIQVEDMQFIPIMINIMETMLMELEQVKENIFMQMVTNMKEIL